MTLHLLTMFRSGVSVEKDKLLEICRLLENKRVKEAMEKVRELLSERGVIVMDEPRLVTFNCDKQLGSIGMLFPMFTIVIDLKQSKIFIEPPFSIRATVDLPMI
jgi:hypothetical protein